MKINLEHINDFRGPVDGDTRGATTKPFRPTAGQSVLAIEAAQAMQRARDARALAEANAFAALSGEGKAGPGLTYEQISLADLTTTDFRDYPNAGFGLWFKRAGSHAGALLDIDLGGLIVSLAPGDALPGIVFPGFRLRLNALSPSTGTAILLIAKSPTARFEQLALATGGLLRNNSCGPAGALTQTINSAAGNIPTAAGDGVSLTGASGFRVVLSAPSGQTLSGGGSLRFWKRPVSYNTGATSKGTVAASGARWAPMNAAYVDLTPAAPGGSIANQRDFIGPDEQNTIGDGEIYAEARSVTASGGAGLVVAVETW